MVGVVSYVSASEVSSRALTEKARELSVTDSLRATMHLGALPPTLKEAHSRASSDCCRGGGQVLPSGLAPSHIAIPSIASTQYHVVL